MCRDGVGRTRGAARVCATELYVYDEMYRSCTVLTRSNVSIDHSINTAKEMCLTSSRHRAVRWPKHELLEAGTDRGGRQGNARTRQMHDVDGRVDALSCQGRHCTHIKY